MMPQVKRVMVCGATSEEGDGGLFHKTPHPFCKQCGGGHLTHHHKVYLRQHFTLLAPTPHYNS